MEESHTLPLISLHHPLQPFILRSIPRLPRLLMFLHGHFTVSCQQHQHHPYQAYNIGHVPFTLPPILMPPSGNPCTTHFCPTNLGTSRGKLPTASYPTALSLFRINAYPSMNCHHCTNTETIDHLPLHCPTLRTFWSTIKRYILDISDGQITLTDQIILFLDYNYASVMFSIGGIYI